MLFFLRTPELAPVELLFGQPKKKMLNSNKTEGINLSKEEDIEKLLNEIRVMESRQVLQDLGAFL